MSSEPEILPAEVPEDRLAPGHLGELRRAVATLEGGSLARRLGTILGRQIDVAAQFVPAPVLAVANRATAMALRVALRAAVRSLKAPDQAIRPANRLHVALAAVSGAAGGAFGVAALPVELPVSTTIMLRSIADIARSEGEDLRQPEALLACLEVFALGGGQEVGPAAESGYLAMRAVLSKSVSEAARYMVQRGIADESAPVIVRLLGQIAARFGIVVGQKAMSQAVPVIGAVTGAAVNAAFTDHFQSLARAHFTVRRLERLYGEDVVRPLFESLRRELKQVQDAKLGDDDRAPATPPRLLAPDAS